MVFGVVINNMYGAIRLRQERHYPGRTVGTDLYSPDFASPMPTISINFP